MARLCMHLLGPLRVILDGEPATGFASDKARALLAYLAVEANRPHRREFLVGLLWPDYPEQDARRSLSAALVSVRKVIGDREAEPPFLHASHQSIQFNSASDSWVDVAAFNTRLQATGKGQRADVQTIAHLAEAIEWYEGAFLEGFSLPDSAPFEEWALVEREHLSRMAEEALERLVEWHQSRGEIQLALGYARRRLELDPLRESAHCQLMCLLALDGQRVAALKQYEVCRDILRAELDVEPDEKTAALYQQIKVGGLQAPAPALAISQPRAPIRQGRRPFPGLSSYGIEDRGIFFGRAREIVALAAQIERDPIVVVNGLSGCGKSSLIKAGVMPLLQESGYQVVYTPVFEHITNDILHEIGRLQDAEKVPQDYVDALHELHRAAGSKHVVLFVDQFEEALGPSQAPEALEIFLRGIPRLLRQAHRIATLVIVLRADWLYFLSTAVRRSYPRLNVYSIIFTLDPLTGETAREAIVKPLQAEGLPFDEEVIEEIIHSLLRSSTRPAMGPYIQPIHLQIVLRALSDAAEDAGLPQQAFTEECYRQSGGVESILRNYLTDSLANRPEAWRLLARFVGGDSRTARTIRGSELLAVPTAEDVQSELDFLVYQGFVEAHEAEQLGDAYYRLAHDSLVDVIVDYLSRNPDQHGWRLAEDWLASGVREWQDSTKHENGDDLLLEKHRYLQIYQYRDKLKVMGESKRLLLLTALHYGHGGLGYWLSREPCSAEDVQIVAGKLLSSDLTMQNAARRALAGCVQPGDDPTTVLREPEKQSLRDELRQAMISPTDSAKRDAAVQALWTLGAFDTAGEQVRIGAAVFRNWIQNHRAQIASYALTALVVLALIGGILLVRERLRGSWQVSTSLKAGYIPLVVADPQEPGTIYAFAMGGPGPRQGVSLFAWHGEKWQPVRYDLTKASPTSMVITHQGSSSRLYVSIYARGILRSDDEGQAWELTNRGLPSFGLTSLVADKHDPNVLYAGTDDWRGVLVSSDSGDSWQLYDYTGEVFGARITRLAYTRADGGTLLAGTEDGRILAHPRGASGWQLRHGLSKGTISALTVAGPDDRIVYAGTSGGLVLRSQNAGQLWEVLGQPANQFNITTLAADPADSQQVYVGTYGDGGYTIWKSWNMGASWEMVPAEGLPRTYISSLVVLSDPSPQLVVGTADGLFASHDGGFTFWKEPLEAPLAAVRKVAISKRHAAPVYAIVGGTVYTNLEGDLNTWILGRGLRAERVRTLVVDPDNPRVAYAGVMLLGQWSVFATEDGGQTWEQTTTPAMAPGIPDTTALALAKTSNGQTILYAGTLGCGVLRSNDGGRSWETYGRAHCDEAGQGDMPSVVFMLAIDAGNPDVVYAADGQLFFRSTDGGRIWEQHSLGVVSSIMDLVADPVLPQTVYLVTASDGFWSSRDGGTTWHKPDGQPFAEAELRSVACLSEQAAQLIVGASNGGVWTTADGGQTWHSIREQLAIGDITSIATNRGLEGRILVSSLSDGIAMYTPGRLIGGNR